MVWRKEGNVPCQCVRTRQERLEGQRKSQNTAGSWRKEEASKSRENKPGMKMVARERERERDGHRFIRSLKGHTMWEVYSEGTRVKYGMNQEGKF